MAGPHFMLADIAGTLGAVCLFTLFVVIPGYVAGWLADLFEFRRRSWVFRIALAVPLSIALCPVLTYLAGRFGSIRIAWIAYGVCWAASIPIFARGQRPRIERQWFALIAIAAGWMALALFSMIDVQFGDRSYYPVLALDYGFRTQFIHAIQAHGIPPASPFFFPGHTVPLRYHYFWLAICSLVADIVGPRMAWMGGTIWCGFGFLALIALYFRLFAWQSAAVFRRRTLIGIALVCVTGLDIIPTAMLWVLRATGMKTAIFPIMQLWNEQVFGFVSTALWTAHHLASLISCLTAFLLLSHPGGKLRYACLAGVALASSAGTSIYVSFVFVVFLAAWTGVVIWKRWWSEFRSLAVAGAVALLLLIPYALELRGGPPGGSPVRFWIRPFRPMDVVMRLQHFSPAMRAVLNGAVLPLNYFLELGVFFAAAVVWWRKRRGSGRPFTRPELAITAMVGTSILVCTFMRSSVISNNDLGWRGFLLAQFGLLFWAVDVFTDKQRAHRGLLATLLVLGAAGTAYDVLILRVFPILADHDFVVRAPWIPPDRDLGRRTFASREAYEWIDRLPANEPVIQYNPRVAGQEVTAFLYSARQVAAADEVCISDFGGPPALCAPMVAQLNDLYAGAQTIGQVCRNLPIDVIVAKDTDPVWADRASWVWSTKPLYANAYYRVFGCH